MSDSPSPVGPVAVGFLAILQDSSGVLGGYLVTNGWGRPLEFRLTTAVQPNRVQQILYGPTLIEYLHAELIGKTLVDKASTQPLVIVTDSVPALGLQVRVGIPVVALGPASGLTDVVELVHPRSTVPLLTRKSLDPVGLIERLDRLDPVVDLAEPFMRIREAIAEARKMGVTGRAA